MRQLGRLTAAGALAPLSEGTEHVQAARPDRARLLRARLHPMALLLALGSYASGHGQRGKRAGAPVGAIVAASNAAF